MIRLTHEQAMELAITEGRKGLGKTSPNPAVGCVILDKNGYLISQGHHKKAGGPHAEVEAIRKVINHESLVDAHVFVTLEPCAKEGRTPACAEMLAKFPIAKVTYGLKDPNPSMRDGSSILEKAGKEVEQYKGVLEKDLRELCEVFLYNQTHRLPFVALKYATSLDGKMCDTGATNISITGQRAKEHTHNLRSIYDAILIGRRTFEIDDPELNIRYGELRSKKLKVFILDPSGKSMPRLKNSKLIKAHAPEDIYWVVAENFIYPKELSLPPENIITVPQNRSGLELNYFLSHVYQRGITSLFVEGGNSTLVQFLQSIVDPIV